MFILQLSISSLRGLWNFTVRFYSKTDSGKPTMKGSKVLLYTFYSLCILGKLQLPQQPLTLISSLAQWDHPMLCVGSPLHTLATVLNVPAGPKDTDGRVPHLFFFSQRSVFNLKSVILDSFSRVLAVFSSWAKPTYLLPYGRSLRKRIHNNQ